MNLTYETLWNGVRSGLLVSMLGKLSWFRLTGLIANGSIDVKMDSCYLELLGKLQKRTCRAVGPSLAASLEPLAHHHNVDSLSLFYRYYFGQCFSELAQLVPLPFSQGRSTCYSDRLHDFSVTIPRYYKDVYVNSFFPHTARLWNSLPKQTSFNYMFFLNRFRVCCYLFLLLFLVTPCLALAVEPCMEWIPIEKKECFSITNNGFKSRLCHLKAFWDIYSGYLSPCHGIKAEWH